MKTKLTQKEAILKHLLKKPITPLEALNKYGCFRLSAIIFKLKRDGFKIETKIAKGGKGYAIYKLIK